MPLLCKPYPMQRRLVRRVMRLLGALRLRRLHCESKTSLPATVRLDRCSPNDRTRLIDLVFLWNFPFYGYILCKHVLSALFEYLSCYIHFPFCSCISGSLFYLFHISSPQSAFRAFLKSAPSFLVTIFSPMPSAVHSFSVIFPLSIFG